MNPKTEISSQEIMKPLPGCWMDTLVWWENWFLFYMCFASTWCWKCHKKNLFYVAKYHLIERPKLNGNWQITISGKGREHNNILVVELRAQVVGYPERPSRIGFEPENLVTVERRDISLVSYMYVVIIEKQYTFCTTHIRFRLPLFSNFTPTRPQAIYKSRHTTKHRVYHEHL